jgi:metal-responsive CopG/Arc/MetJ family transcriptional regulator
MTNIKTAISIDKPLFEEVDALARELEVSRSRLFSLAVSDFIQRRKNNELLEAINAAYQDSPDSEEQQTLERMKAVRRRIVKDSWK